MFFGTTPSIVSQFIYSEIKKHNPKRVIVPFAGNFVIEQIAGLVSKDIEVLSTDVSTYSRAIGYGLGDMESEIEIKEELTNIFSILKGNKSPIEKAACVIFLAEASKNIKKSEKTKYYQMLHKDALENQEMYYNKILEKLSKFKENLPYNFKFYGTDACELIKKIKKDDVVFYDPPVDLGNYESEFKILEECYNFTQPEYTQMDDTVKAEQLNYLTEIGATSYYRNNNPLSEEFLNSIKGYKEVYRYQYKYNGHYCVYGNNNHKNFVGQWSPIKEELINLKLINEQDIITEDSKIELVQVKNTIANHYRLMWVKKAEMLDSGWSWLVMIDDKVAGVLQLLDGVKFGSELIVINSDPCCPYSKYKRLSKLMLYVCCTEEVQNMINDKSMWEHVGFTTRVFTNAPVSMKYRSLFDLKEREEETEGNYKYKLIYQNKRKIEPTIKDGLAKWLKKDGKQLITK